MQARVIFLILCFSSCVFIKDFIEQVQGNFVLGKMGMDLGSFEFKTGFLLFKNLEKHI